MDVLHSGRRRLLLLLLLLLLPVAAHGVRGWRESVGFSYLPAAWLVVCYCMHKRVGAVLRGVCVWRAKDSVPSIQIQQARSGFGG